MYPQIRCSNFTYGYSVSVINDSTYRSSIKNNYLRITNYEFYLEYINLSQKIDKKSNFNINLFSILCYTDSLVVSLPNTFINRKYSRSIISTKNREYYKKSVTLLFSILTFITIITIITIINIYK